MISESEISKWVKEATADTDIFIVEISVSPRKVLVYLDKPEGVTISECSRIGRYIQKQMEPLGVLELYDMEVSSPGMDKPLKVYQQYLRRIGREMHVLKVDGQEVNGVLKEVNESTIALESTSTSKEGKKKVVNVSQVEIPFSEIKEAKIILTFK